MSCPRRAVKFSTYAVYCFDSLHEVSQKHAQSMGLRLAPSRRLRSDLASSRTKPRAITPWPTLSLPSARPLRFVFYSLELHLKVIQPFRSGRNSSSPLLKTLLHKHTLVNEVWTCVCSPLPHPFKTVGDHYPSLDCRSRSCVVQKSCQSWRLTLADLNSLLQTHKHGTRL